MEDSNAQDPNEYKTSDTVDEVESGQMQPLEEPATPPTGTSDKKRKLTIIAGSVLLGLGLLALMLVLVFIVFKKEVAAPTAENTTTGRVEETEAIGAPNEIVVPQGDFSYIEPVLLDTDVKWQELLETDLRGFRQNEVLAIPDSYEYVEGKVPVTYYVAGTFEGGEVVYLFAHAGSIEESVEVFLVHANKKAELLQRYQQQFVQPGITSENALDASVYNSEKVAVNINAIFRGTTAPQSVTIRGQKMKLPTYRNYFLDTDTRVYSNTLGQPSLLYRLGTAPTESVVSTIPEGTIYEIVTQKDGYKLSLFELEMPNHFRVSYEIDGELSNAFIQPITWLDGTRNTAEYKSFGAGCGGGQYSLVADLTKDDVVQIGTSDKKQIIYGFKDMAHPVASTILSEVNSRGGIDEYIDENEPKYTAEEFVKDRAIIIVEDGMGRWVVFKNLANFIQGGCAKPVIYLYPEQPTVLDVQVGADVTVSDPYYETNGWQDVTALPSGQLLYRGRVYESLFWEGLGRGNYPNTSGLGVVVQRSKVIETMYAQLAEQGFNSKESDDFVEFWSQNIPSGKYVRMTWLNTREMNELAPLYLSTKPDTLIRTFLEMEGLDRPIVLTPQKFTAPTREGFVVTEWGGLAVDGLDQLNYSE
jgi:hypothetical protein